MTIVDISKFLFFTSTIVWILPPIKQYNGKYFLYFLILACMDPIHMLFSFITKSTLPSQISVLILFCLLLSLIERLILKKYWVWIVLITIVLFAPTIFNFNRNEIIFVYILLQLGMGLIILKNLITNFVSVGKLSLFHLVLLFYQFTNVAKYSNILIGFADAIAFFILSTIAQIIFGLFFSIYREDKSGLVI